MDTYNEKPQSYLEQLIKLICKNNKFHICIYDVSGIFYNKPIFSLPNINQFHNAPFCLAVKESNKGMKFCLKCKYHSFIKATKQDSPFTGRCYLGITEVVRPVFINNKLGCIIYIGNIYNKDKIEDTNFRIDKYANLMNIAKDKLINELDLTESVTSVKLDEYFQIAELIHKSVLYAYKANPDRSLSANDNKKPLSFFVQTALNYVYTYYSNDIKIEYIAQLLFVNPNYLRNIFKKQTGSHFTDYLNRVRIDKACELLVDSTDSIIKVAARVGFNNVSYFNRLFKQYKGCSPRDYRTTV